MKVMNSKQVGVAAVAGIVALSGMTEASLANRSGNSEICRKATEALMRGDTEAAVLAVDPAPSDRTSAQDNLTKLTNGVAALFKGKTPRLERTMSDAYAGAYPVSLQIWSFGDKEVYFVGCLFRMREEGMQLQLQVDSSADDVVAKLKTISDSN